MSLHHGKGSGMASFKQQELKAWQPVLTPVAVIAMLLCVFVVFLPIGIVLEDCSNRVIEQSVRYDTLAECNDVTASLNYTQLPKECQTGDIELLYDFEPPIYVYYELRNFYQNHRRFSSSKSDAQLRGEGNTEDTSQCDPIEKSDGDTIVPCGLFPGSFFEDRFTMEFTLPSETGAVPLCPYAQTSDPCHFWGADAADDWNAHWANWTVDGLWQKEGIAWDSDVDDKFKYEPLSGAQSNRGPRQIQSGLDLPRADDEDLIVWMRAAALPNFRKLHRIIEELPEDSEGERLSALPKGTMVNFLIASWFPTKDFEGEKWLTIAKTEWCGGANHALAWTYIVVASVAIGLTVTFAILLLFGSRKMADVNRFAWHNRPTNSPLVSID